MHVWLVNEGEALPSDDYKDRLRRMGLLAKTLQEKGHEVTWFNSTFYHSRKLQREKNDRSIKINKNYTIQLIWSNPYKKNISIFRVIHHIITGRRFCEVAKNVKEPDIILCSMPTIELAEAVVDYAKKYTIPVVVDIRDLWPDIYNEMLPKPLSFIARPYIRNSKKRLTFLLKRADAITALTESFLMWGLQYANREISENDRVFSMAYKKELDLKTDKTDKFIELYKSDLEKGDFLVSFFGTIGKQFEFQPILQAARKLATCPYIKFIICGDGVLLNQLMIESKNLNNVIFPGWVEKDKISELLSITDLGIAPYRDSMNFTKNIPNKFGEYLSGKIPVLLSIEGEMSNLLREYDCGYVYRDGNDLAMKIKEQYLDKEKHQMMKSNAKRLFLDKFDADKVYEDMANHLNDIVKRSKNV